MYSDDDLNFAIRQGIFTQDSVNQFRTAIASQRNTQSVDEENFKLIGGFNDIFVVIASILLLSSTYWAFSVFGLIAAAISLPTLAWVLAEFFILKRKMALPAIILMLAFVGGIFSLCLQLFAAMEESAFLVASLGAMAAAYIHWKRFSVPITIAALTAACAGVIASTVATIIPESKLWLMLIIFLCGIGCFLFAMYWDASDTQRISYRSDVAFWLHLLAAPLIIHPVFFNLGVFEGSESATNMSIILALYIVMTLLSIIIDRRALMVSSLIYVLYATANILEAYGFVDYSFATTGIFIGSALLLLSAFWHAARVKLVNKLPKSVKQYIPAVAQDEQTITHMR